MKTYKPDWKPGITWGEYLGEPDCPYMRRWVLNFGFFAIRLHRWYRSDDKRYFHDHPWSFLTVVLKGGYTDISPEGKDRLRAPAVAFRKALHRHTVVVDPGGATTLLISGPHQRKWGFWIDGQLIRVRKYFREYGHPPCEEP